LASFTQGFNVQSNALTNQLQHFTTGARRRDAARQVWNLGAVTGLAFFHNN
jgi:hypothetical protein